jgi:hypothetical protein
VVELGRGLNGRDSGQSDAGVSHLIANEERDLLPELLVEAGGTTELGHEDSGFQLPVIG